jgi:hypothetical protein
MKWLVAILFIVFSVSCSSLPKHEPISILSSEKVVDNESQEVSICKKFKLTDIEIEKYFSIAESMSPIESNQRLTILPCKYSGELKLSGNLYKYEIYAGGSGFLYDQEGWLYRGYLCDSNRCCSMFNSLC